MPSPAIPCTPDNVVAFMVERVEQIERARELAAKIDHRGKSIGADAAAKELRRLIDEFRHRFGYGS